MSRKRVALQRERSILTIAALASVVVFVLGCQGTVATESEGGPSGVPFGAPGNAPGFPTGAAATAPNAFGGVGVRRLSAEEVHHALLDGLNVDVSDQLHLLPLDEAEPFDNDYTKQTPSAALIAGLDALGKEAGARFVQDTARPRRDRGLLAHRS